MMQLKYDIAEPGVGGGVDIPARPADEFEGDFGM